jgi:arsenite methyltransferase
MTAVDLRHHKADYGYDGDYRAVSAPTVAAIVATVSAGLLASAARSLVRGKPVAAAKLLPSGRAIGVDIWRADQNR